MQKDGFIGSIDTFNEYRPDELDLTRWTRCDELLADLDIYDKIKSKEIESRHTAGSHRVAHVDLV